MKDLGNVAGRGVLQTHSSDEYFKVASETSSVGAVDLPFVGVNLLVVIGNVGGAAIHTEITEEWCTLIPAGAIPI